MRFFQVKVKYIKTQENGSLKRVGETYVLDAETFGEAEARITKELEPYKPEEFEVTAIRPIPISLFLRQDQNGRFYDVMVCHVAFDPVTCKEIKVPYTYLIQDTDAESAGKSALLKCVNGLNDVEITHIKETGIVEVFWTEEPLINSLE